MLNKYISGDVLRSDELYILPYHHPLRLRGGNATLAVKGINHRIRFLKPVIPRSKCFMKTDLESADNFKNHQPEA